MKRTLNFYLDDSGTRTPNRKPLLLDSGKNEFFALGGVLINEEDEGRVRAAYQELCARWSIDYPLHSVEIRHSSQAFIAYGANCGLISLADRDRGLRSG